MQKRVWNQFEAEGNAAALCILVQKCDEVQQIHPQDKGQQYLWVLL